MKTLFLGASALASLFALSAPANALDLYGKIGAGQATNVDVGGFSADGEGSLTAALGADLGLIRVEGGVTRAEAEAFGGAVNASVYDFHATGFVDLSITDRFAIFGGAGLDYVNAEADVGFGSIEESGTGWHWTAGASYQLSERITLEASYRRTNFDVDPGFGDIDVEYDTLGAGLRFKL